MITEKLDKNLYKEYYAIIKEQKIINFLKNEYQIEEEIIFQSTKKNQRILYSKQDQL